MSDSAKRMGPRLLVPGLGILLAGTAVLPATATHAAVVDLGATDNGYVLRSAPTTVQDSSQTLQTKTPNNSKTRVAYLRFDVSNFLANNSPSDITGATLKLALTGASAVTGDTATVYGLNDGAANSAGETTETDWTGNTTSATGITFSNQPAGTVAQSASGLPTSNTTSALGSLVINQTLTGAPAFAENDIPLDPAALASFLGSDTNGQITLLFVSSTGSQQDAWASASNTGSFPVPTLELTTGAAVPEPATVAIVGVITALGLVRRRRSV